MRAGVSTVQQTLTAEAASILKQAVTEASKRGHAQATPLHVAATLLVSPNSLLRRACLQTHPHSPHLRDCRGLELCFNVALQRLQAAQNPLPNGQPSYSNALVAALKRAQAHQRRGCPEQQQQPLLAVKVELEQLIISILDDPSVSRVMREAGFSSTDVKSHLEDMASLMASHHSVSHGITDPVRLPLSVSAIDQMGFRVGGIPPAIFGGVPLSHHLTPFRNSPVTQDRNDMQLHIRPSMIHSPYMNPMLLKQGGILPMSSGCEELKQVLEVLSRKTRRNPVLLGDSAARVDGVIKDVIQQIERGNAPEQLLGVKIISANLSYVTLMSTSKEDLRMRFLELNKSVQELVLRGGVVVNLGNLQWLLQLRASASQAAGFCPVQFAVNEIKDLFAQHHGSSRMWLLGTSTHQTFMNCQALYPDLESQMELQPVIIGALGNGTLSARTQDRGINSLAVSLLRSPGATLQLSMPGDGAGEKLTCCPECSKKYEKEALLLRDQEGGKQPDSPQSCSSSVETPSKLINDQGVHSTGGSQPALPLWLQKALPDGSKSTPAAVVEVYDKPLPLAMRLQELLKKWNQACRSIHAERLSCWNVSTGMCQRPSPLSDQVSGNPLDCTLSLLRENSTGPGVTRPVACSFSALNGHHSSKPIAPNLISLPNGTSEQLLQIRTHKDRVQEERNGCSDSMIRLPWQLTSAAMPEARTTEAATPCSPFDSPARGQSSRLFLRMNPDALGQLCKGLLKKVGWQPGIVSSIAKTVIQCRSGLGKRAGAGVSFKGDTWLLFLGHDRPGKRLMAEALAELNFGEDKKPICLTFGKQQDVNSPATWSLGLSVLSRGKMPLDQLADAIRHNPSSLFYLEDIEQADSVFRSSLLRAMSKGGLVDSSGRDVSFNSVIVVMTSSVGIECQEGKCTTAGSQFRKVSPQSTNEDCTHLQASLKQWPVSKRKGSWDADDDSKGRESSGISKRANLGLSLDLDLNLAAEENDNVAFPVPVLDSCGVLGTMRPDVSDEEVIYGAQKQLGELCDFVDAAVVFASPL